MRTESWTSHTAHLRRCLYSIGLSPPKDEIKDSSCFFLVFLYPFSRDELSCLLLESSFSSVSLFLPLYFFCVEKGIHYIAEPLCFLLSGHLTKDSQFGFSTRKSHTQPSIFKIQFASVLVTDFFYFNV
jgi:hypothetical protein